MRARLADIAVKAQVSEATVSRVLNDRPGVAGATRAAVLEALDLLGYDRPARLRRRSVGLVGLITPELTNPIYPAMAQTIESELARQGYTPVLCTQTLGGVHEDDYVQLLLDHGVAGIIFVAGHHADTDSDPQRYRNLRDKQVPIVLVNGYVDDIDAPFISTDDAAAVDLSVRHLVSLGHRRIGLAIGPDRYTPVIRKVAAFLQAMRQLTGADDAETLVETSLFTVEGGVAAGGRLLDRGVTALVCGSDLMALGAIRAARQRGLNVPGDVSVVGYDDSTLIPFLDPPLTTVRQLVQPMCEAAVRALLDEIQGRPAPRAEYMFRPELVVRGSTAAVRQR